MRRPTTTMMNLESSHIVDASIAVDCTRDVRFRRTLRSLVQHVVPCCLFQPSSSSSSSSAAAADEDDARSTATHCGPSSTATVTGTFFGYRRGRVSFSLHEDPPRASSPPLLLLDFTVPTAYIAREMQHGVLRIALECDRSAAPLFGVPAWSMYCNGRKVGYAVRRQMTEGDASMFRLMQSVSVGAGAVPPAAEATSGDGGGGGGGELMYFRARFERVVGSADSESFHMMNPAGSTAQQLSIFLLRT